MKIPLIDLRAQYLSIKEDLDTAISNVLEGAVFVGGDPVADFEAAFAAAYGLRHCVGLANGTDAILVALHALGIGEGDEVITGALSWISTADAISRIGATPVFADIAPNGYNIDVTQIETKITAQTRAIKVVHLYGHPADMDPIVALCKKYDLKLIEDCAQAHFATYKGQRVGTFGDIATFSFYPTKNLGAYGDAGAVLTNNDELAHRCRVFANQGAAVRHHHVLTGINSRLDTLQAAILKAKLTHIHRWNADRRRVAATYDRLLKDINEVIRPQESKYAHAVYYLYVIRCERRDELMQYLTQQGIGVAIHYPTPLPLQPLYEHLGYNEESIPVVAAYSRQLLSLPMYPELSDAMCGQVVDAIRAFYEA